MPKRITRADQTGRNRDQVLAAARRVFLAKGYERATLEAIAREAGFSKGVVYSQFESKADLFLALLERRIDQRATQNEAIAKRHTGEETVAAIARAAREDGDEQRGLAPRAAGVPAPCGARSRPEPPLRGGAPPHDRRRGRAARARAGRVGRGGGRIRAPPRDAGAGVRVRAGTRAERRSARACPRRWSSAPSRASSACEGSRSELLRRVPRAGARRERATQGRALRADAPAGGRDRRAADPAAARAAGLRGRRARRSTRGGCADSTLRGSSCATSRGFPRCRRAS